MPKVPKNFVEAVKNDQNKQKTCTNIFQDVIAIAMMKNFEIER